MDDAFSLNIWLHIIAYPSIIVRVADRFARSGSFTCIRIVFGASTSWLILFGTLEARISRLELPPCLFAMVRERFVVP